MKCAQCDADIEQSSTQLVADYLCKRCRVNMDPEQWDDRDRVMQAIQEWLRSRGEFYYGHQIIFPKDSSWAWVKVYEDPDMVDHFTHESLQNVSAYDSYLSSLTVRWYYVWKHTGAVYQSDASGAIEDDPIFVPSFA